MERDVCAVGVWYGGGVPVGVVVELELDGGGRGGEPLIVPADILVAGWNDPVAQ